jgi:hypothetical protein
MSEALPVATLLISIFPFSLAFPILLKPDPFESSLSKVSNRAPRAFWSFQIR